MNIPQFINQEGVSPTMAGWNSGVKQRDTLQNSAVARMLQETQAQNIQGRLAMDQAEHPLKLEGLRYDNEGKQIGNTRARGQVTDEENKRRMDSMDNFFKYLNENPDDPEGAFVYSGVPRNGKFQALAQASPQERQKVIDKWRKDRAAMDEQKAKYASDLRTAEQKANNDEIYRREQMKAQEATRRAIETGRQKAELKSRELEAKAAQMKGSSLEQGLDLLLNEQRSIKNMWSSATTDEQRAAILERLNEVQQEIDRRYEMWAQGKILSAAQRQSGAVDLGAASGGQFPVRPPPSTQTPPLGGQDPNRARAPAGVPGPAVKRFDPATGTFVTVPQ